MGKRVGGGRVKKAERDIASFGNSRPKKLLALQLAVAFTEPNSFYEITRHSVITVSHGEFLRATFSRARCASLRQN